MKYLEIIIAISGCHLSETAARYLSDSTRRRSVAPGSARFREKRLPTKTHLNKHANVTRWSLVQIKARPDEPDVEHAVKPRVEFSLHYFPRHCQTSFSSRNRICTKKKRENRER